MSSLNESPNQEKHLVQAWYKYGHVWLIIAGPLLVILAGIVTVYLALTRPDPIVDEHYYQHGIEINKTLNKQSSEAMQPAIKARNHAATGVNDQE